jgi:hypothetical protein
MSNVSDDTAIAGQPALRYPWGAIAGDYARAGAGVAFTVALIVFARPAPVAVVVLGALAGLFALFALNTARRHWARVCLRRDDIALSGRSIRWSRLSGVRLRYFGRRRESADGWMELTLKSSTTRIRVDSSLDGFLDIARAALAAAQANGVALNAASRANFRALGLDAGEGP